MAKRIVKPSDKNKKPQSRKKAASASSRAKARSKKAEKKAGKKGDMLSTTPWWKGPILLYGGIAALISLIMFSPALDFGFVNWDDPDYVTENPLVQNPTGESFSRYWTESMASNYHPLTMMSLGLTVKLFGMDPFVFHLTNILIHLLNIFLVFAFVYRLSEGNKWIAFFVAMAFGAHPMHVESVAWVTERKDVLFTAFFMGGLLYYLKHLQVPKAKYLILTLLMFMLSVLSKPTAVTFPLVLILLDYYYKRPLLSKQVILEKVPFFLIAVIFGIITVQVQSEEAIGDFAAFTFIERLTFASYGFVMYIVKLFVPIKLAAFYPTPKTGELPGWYFLMLPAALTLVGLTLYSMRKTRLIAFCMGFYAVTVALTLQFVTVGSALAADRYTYVPYIGLLILIGYGLDELVKRMPKLKTAVYGLTGVVLLLWAVGTYQRTLVWENDLTLWDDVIENYPEAATAYMSRGKYYKDNGQIDKALADFKRSIELDDTNDKVYNNRGNIFFAQNNFEKALPDYNRSIELEPNVARYFDNRGALYAKMGNFQAALQDMNRAIQLNPEFYNTYKNRALVHSSLGDYQAAVKDYQVYLRQFPRDHVFYNAMAVEYQKMGNHQQAIQALGQAIRLQPKQGAYYLNRAFSYNALRQKQNGLKDVQRAKQLGAEIPPVLINELNAAQ